MRLFKKEKEVVQESLGLEESRFKNGFLNFKHKFIKLGKEAHYSGIYTNFWLWNVVFANIAISIILLVLINRSLVLLPKNIGINLDTIKGYDHIVRKEILYAPVALHILILIITPLFVFKQGKKINHLLILLLLNTFVLAFFEVKGIGYVIEYFK